MIKSAIVFLFSIFAQYCFSENQNIIPPPQIDSEQLERFEDWKTEYFKHNSKKLAHQKLSELYLNELIFSHSPYLAQHSNDPINWKAWSSELLAKAKNENKLIFLSIGYSTCHWCHVMQKESFSQISLAKILNKNFYSIKVDREELPHIDNYYMRALQQLKGNAGWPITAIINGDGLPIFIDSYMPKEKLIQLLSKIHNIWKKQPRFLLDAAENIDHLLNKETETLSHLVVNHNILDSINKKLVTLLDQDFGGFSGEVKFPTESMLLYGLDQLRRAPQRELEKLIKLQLDSMIKGGIYDHVGGGFHRYSVDSTWTVPHFEKMLYNQAQLIDVYSQAYEYFHDKQYLDIVSKTTEMMINEFYKTDIGFVSAYDADFNAEEGGYYLWKKEEIEELGIPDGLYQTYQVRNSNKLGLILYNGNDENKILETSKIRNKLLSIRKLKAPLYYDKKVLTGWNGLAIKGLVSAAITLNKAKYIRLASKLSDQIWNERYDEKTGFLARTRHSFLNRHKRKINQSYLDDYAYLADAYIALYDYDGDMKWLERVKKLKHVITQDFMGNKGAFFNISVKNLNFASKKAIDSEIISPAATMLNVLFKLGLRTGESKQYLLKTYIKQINNLSSNITAEPMSHLYASFVLNQIINSSQNRIRHLINNVGTVEFTCRSIILQQCTRFQIAISLKDGWHINSDKPLQDYLIATKLDLPSGFETNYPEAKLVKLGFQQEALSIFEKNILISLSKPKHMKGHFHLSLPIQACSDQLCLLPETLDFVM